MEVTIQAQDYVATIKRPRCRKCVSVFRDWRKNSITSFLSMLVSGEVFEVIACFRKEISQEDSFFHFLIVL